MGGSDVMGDPQITMVVSILSHGHHGWILLTLETTKGALSINNRDLMGFKRIPSGKLT
jgi:hypothetical protein